MEFKDARRICDDYQNKYNEVFKPTKTAVCGFMERGDLLAAIVQNNDNCAGVDDDWEISETIIKIVQWVIPDTLLVRMKDEKFKADIQKAISRFEWDVITAMDNKELRDDKVQLEEKGCHE